MNSEAVSVLVLGEPGPLLSGLIEKLARLGAQVFTTGGAPPAGTPSVAILAWSPPPDGVAGPDDATLYPERVAGPVAELSRLQGLSHLCLVRSESLSAAAAILEHALGMLARQRGIPLLVADAAGAGTADRLAEAAALATAARLSGHVRVGAPA